MLQEPKITFRVPQAPEPLIDGIPAAINTAIELFARYYCSDDLTCKVPEFHREMYRLAESGKRRIVICAPRSFAKSTVFSKVYPLFQILEGAKDIKRILIISATGTLAEHWLRQIKEVLEGSPIILMELGDVRTKKWTQDHIVVQHPNGRRVEVQAKGAGYQVRGFRPDIIIVDDIETDEGVRSEDQRSKLLDWFNKALINTLEAKSQLVMIGTLLHPLSLLQNVMNRDGWESRKYKAVQPDGSSLWPEKWTSEELEERRREIGAHAFNSEYQNEPMISENPIFVKQWIQEYDGLSKSSPVSDPSYTVMACDPAISKRESADYTAIVTISAVVADGGVKYYVRCAGGVSRGHWPLNKTVEELRTVYRRFKVNKLAIEEVAFQKAVADEFVRYAENERWFPQVVRVRPDKDKERRAHAIASMLERGEVFFDLEDTMTCRLVDELMVFPTGDHDDLVDAFVYGLTELKKWNEFRAIDGVGPHVVLPPGYRVSSLQRVV